jgi:hypothetical protein
VRLTLFPVILRHNGAARRLFGIFEVDKHRFDAGQEIGSGVS